jgi:NADPH2:quinone reductase
MKAVVCRQHGDPNVLEYTELDSPTPGPGEVRIAVHAAGVNFADILQVAGTYQVKPAFPFSPGLEVAGEVVECGKGVGHLKVGDRVVSLCQHGAYAEEIVVPGPAAIPLPDDMDFITAAGFLVTYGTSHLALDHRGGLRSGETLLVHGAGGGVGHTAVELGKLLGATVIATAGSDKKLALAKECGADHLINYRTEDFRSLVKKITQGRGADVIYDPVGGDVFDESLRCINWAGRLLVIGFASGRIPAAPANRLLVKNCAVVGVFWGAYLMREPQIIYQSIQQLLGWVAEGKLKPRIMQTYPLEKASQALLDMAARRSCGKLVIEIR